VVTRLSIRISLLVCLPACLLLAQADKPNLSGKWSSGDSNSGVVTQFDQQDNVLHVKEFAPEGGKLELVKEYTCTTDGKECKAKIGGSDGKVTLWFNGPMLVEMATSGRGGSSVVKTRRKISEDGSRMDVDVIHIAPESKTEKLVLNRSSEVSSAQR
jgi:hypothetical protein